MAKTDIDDATGVTSADADKAEQSTRHTLGWILSAAALFHANRQGIPPPPKPARPTQPVDVERLADPLDVQVLETPRLAGRSERLPASDGPELPSAGDTPAAVELTVGETRLETRPETIQQDMQVLSDQDVAVLQRAINNQARADDPEVAIAVSGDRVFYQGRQERYVHPDFDLALARQLVDNLSPNPAAQGRGDSSALGGWGAAVDPVERKEAQARQIEARLQDQQANAAMSQQAGQAQLAMMFDRCLEVSFGKEGSATIVGNKYDIARDGAGGLSVTAKDGRGVIFERDSSGRMMSAATTQDLQNFAKGAAVLEQRQAKSAAMPRPARPQSPSIMKSRQGGMEIG
jgi:hypothetical protein